jgi:F0F1-type ATP synthase membrane subunit b/b'
LQQLFKLKSGNQNNRTPMGLITPNPGLLFWTVLAFSTVLWILWKYAYGPILSSLKDREDFIAQALNAADEARAQMSQLQNENEKLLALAREERDQIPLSMTQKRKPRKKPTESLRTQERLFRMNVKLPSVN